MKPFCSISMWVLVLLCLPLVCLSVDFDFFYFVQQWPGAYCDTKQSCCYPTTGKPAADFGIHGLWPSYKDGFYPSNCDPDSVFDKSQIEELVSSMQTSWPSLSCPSSNGLRLWSHEWKKHGTCSESQLDQRDYFAAALKLKQKSDLLILLQNTGIEADDGFYSTEMIKAAIKEGIGHGPGIQCNKDSAGNSQLYQVYLCVDASGSEFIECPILPTLRRCSDNIQFAKF